MKDAIVFTNGCFDILHRGHIELLRYCKSLGYVVVGLNSDKSVKRLKGPLRPVTADYDRKFLLEALTYVDEVIIFEEDTPLELIKKVAPHIIVKGGDYQPEDVVGKDMAQVKIFNYLSGHSTTEILGKLSE
jgi:D-beta-D-heptose 7-phosphate kinase/D-beta-D-heptose 1-phosphate adenosyltransferase